MPRGVFTSMVSPASRPIRALPSGALIDKQAALDLRLFGTDDLVDDLLLGFLVDQLDPGAELDRAAALLADVDDRRARQLVLDLEHPALDEALPLARGMVFGVLRQIAVLPGLRERPDHGRALVVLQALELLLEPQITTRGHRNPVGH